VQCYRRAGASMRFNGTPLVKAPRTDAPACRTRGQGVQLSGDRSGLEIARDVCAARLAADIALPKWTRGAVQEEGAVVFYLVNAVASARESVTAPALIVLHQ
jgi:hypothetical protein